MSNWTITSRGLRGVALALSVAGAMAFAPSAFATTTTVNTTAGLISAINAANAAGGTNEIIMQPTETGTPAALDYFPTAPITIQPGDNLELTGQPKLTELSTNTSTQTVLNGQQVNPLTANMITVAPGASLLIKGISITVAAATGFSAIEDNGNLEVDNVAMYANTGNDIEIDQTTSTVPNATIDESTIDGSLNAGIANNGGNLALNNTDVVGNTGGGVGMGGGTTVLDNSLIASNTAGGLSDCAGTANNVVNTIDDDTTCGGLTYTDSQIKFQTGDALTFGQGGPTPDQVLKAGSVAYTTPAGTANEAGNPLYCLSDDQRFYSTAGSCVIGSYDPAATSQTSDTAASITCTIGNISESSNPSIASTETINVTDPGGPGLGADADAVPVFLNGKTVTLSEPGNALGYNITDPSAPDPSLTDAPFTSGPLAVTASKPLGDVTAGDTKWGFTVQDWLGNSTQCQ